MIGVTLDEALDEMFDEALDEMFDEAPDDILAKNEIAERENAARALNATRSGTDKALKAPENAPENKESEKENKENIGTQNGKTIVR
jgi:hypothetical protein